MAQAAEAFPDFERIPRRRFQAPRPISRPGILCSILLSYADTPDTTYNGPVASGKGSRQG